MPTRLNSTDINNLSITREDMSSTKTRHITWQHDLGGVTVTTISTDIAAIVTGNVTTGSILSSDNSTSPWETIQTTNTSGDWYARGSYGTVTQLSWEPQINFRILTAASISAIRLWIGLSSIPFANMINPTSGHLVAFSYDTTRDGSAKWQGVTCDNANSTVSELTTISNSTAYNLTIASVSGGNGVNFYVNDSLYLSQTGTLPSSQTQLYWYIGVENTTNPVAAKKIGWSYVDLYQN